MADDKGAPDAKTPTGRKKLTVKKQPVKDLEPQTEKDPKGGRFEKIATPVEHTRAKP